MGSLILIQNMTYTIHSKILHRIAVNNTVSSAQWYKGNGRGEIVDHLFVYFYIVDSIVQWYIQEMLGPAEQICTQYTTKSLVV